jgi:hypothetical protein
MKKKILLFGMIMMLFVSTSLTVSDTAPQEPLMHKYHMMCFSCLHFWSTDCQESQPEWCPECESTWVTPNSIRACGDPGAYCSFEYYCPACQTHDTYYKCFDSFLYAWVFGWGEVQCSGCGRDKNSVPGLEKLSGADYLYPCTYEE